MAPRGSTSSSSNASLTAAHSLSLLSEYTHTLDSLPLDLSRNFADLRELDAVLSSSMSSITTKIESLTNMIEQGTSPKEERLWLLTEIAEEATRLKLGGEDKIRVACQAADNLKSHTGHMRSLAEHVPGFDAATLNRNTTYPHVASRSFMPSASMESGRRRRGGFGSLLVIAPDPSPAKRKRAARDDDVDVQARSPRKTADGSARPRNGARTKKHERALSPTESLLSVTSHVPHQPAQNQASTSRAAANHTSNRVGNGSASTAANKRIRSSATNNNRGPTPQPPQDHYPNASVHDQPNNNNNSNITNSRRDVFNVPPSSSSHPSLPLPYQNNNNGLHANTYDIHSHSLSHSLSSAPVPADWASTRPPHTLEGPGMPVARSLSSQPAITAPSISVGSAEAGGAGTEGAPTEAGDGEGDGDDKTYCFCDGISYGEMIACDDLTCEREWFHLACINLTVPPDGRWFCETCRTKRNAKRAGRGGRRQAQRSRRSAGGVLIG